MSSMLSGNIKHLVRFMAHRAAFPVIETGWAILFFIIGHILHPKPRQWSTNGKERVLVISPHPDDETLGCGATIALHSKAGDSVCVVIVTDGGSSRAGGLDREQIRLLRAREAVASVKTLGSVELLQYGLPEGRWSDSDLFTLLASSLDKYKPTVIYATSCIDYHPEHIRVAATLAKVLATKATTCRAVRVYEVQTPLTPVLVNLVAESVQMSSAKAAALAQYGSQLDSFAWHFREVRYLSRLYKRKGTIEVFWELTPAQFSRLMASGEPSSFPGLRPRPLTDGAIWLSGHRARRQLKLEATKDAHVTSEVSRR